MEFVSLRVCLFVCCFVLLCTFDETTLIGQNRAQMYKLTMSSVLDIYVIILAVPNRHL
jgi:hypothetical protein